MLSQIFDLDSFKVLSLFSLSLGSRFNRNEIKQKIRLNNVPLDKCFLRLLSAGILAREGNFYRVNFESSCAKQVIKLCSDEYKKLKELPFDVYLLLLDLVWGLSTIKGINAYLFGSYSKLVYHEKSDVDIAILTLEKFDKNFVHRTVRKLERKYKKVIETHFFVKKLFYKNKKDPLVKDIIRNGVRLI